MTRDETKTLLMAISVVFPSWKPANLSLAIDTWTILLKDYAREDIEYAFQRYALADKSGFAPSPGQLIEMLRDRIDESAMTDMEAWNLVLRAVRNSSYHAPEEYAALPSEVQRAVGSAEVLRQWAGMDADTLNAIRANFLRTYNARIKAARVTASLPAEMNGARLAGITAAVSEQLGRLPEAAGR